MVFFARRPKIGGIKLFFVLFRSITQIVTKQNECTNSYIPLQIGYKNIRVIRTRFGKFVTTLGLCLMSNGL